MTYPAAHYAAFSLPAARQCGFRRRNFHSRAGEECPARTTGGDGTPFRSSPTRIAASSDAISQPASRSLRPAVTARMKSARSLASPWIKSPVAVTVVALRMLAWWSVGFASATEAVEMDRVPRMFRAGDKGSSRGHREGSPGGPAANAASRAPAMRGSRTMRSCSSQSPRIASSRT
jgi:hypothetical protein